MSLELCPLSMARKVTPPELLRFKVLSTPAGAGGGGGLGGAFGGGGGGVWVIV